MMMLKMVMMVETAHWNMGGVRVSLKAMKSRVILSVKMEFPAPFCEATTRDMYVSRSAAQSLRLPSFPIFAFLTFISCLSSVSNTNSIFLKETRISVGLTVHNRCNGEKMKTLNRSSLKISNSDWIKVKLTNIFACGQFLTFLLLQLLD